VTQAVGIGIAILLLCVLLACIWLSWRRPFVALGLLVAGMAVHNFAVMLLLHLSTPAYLVRAVQGWKEALLLVLIAIAVARIWRERHSSTIGPMIASDWLALAFAALCIVYFLIPSSLLSSDAGLAQRLVGLRTLFMIPLLYFLGRTLLATDDRERLTVVYLCLGAAAMVTIVGVYELFFVPTRTWLDWGVNQYSSFLGFTYHGPYGLPENFFVTLSDGTLIRRMVSTYISPLGLAYSSVMLFPLAVAAMDRRVSQKVARWIAVATALLILGAALSITRLALFGLIGEAVLLTVLLRRAWIAALVPVLIAASIAALLPYSSIAPAVDSNLTPVHRGAISWTVPGSDSSSAEHSDYLKADLLVDFQHPLGLGTGASTIRYGKLVGTGESAILGIFGDLGLAGGFMYLALYALAVWQGFRAFRLSRAASLEELLPLTALVGGLALAPITLTSDVWGDLSVTFLFWWVAGASATMCAQRAKRAARPAWERSWSRRPALG